MPFMALQLQIGVSLLNDSPLRYLENLELKAVIQCAVFDVSRFHSSRPNWPFEPTACPIDNSCTLSALHESPLGQTAAQLFS